MSRRPTVPSTPSPEDPPAPDRDRTPREGFRPVGFTKEGFPYLEPEPILIMAIAGATPSEEAIEVVARRMCAFRGLNPDAVDYKSTVLDKHWRRFYYQAADALIAVNFRQFG